MFLASSHQHYYLCHNYHSFIIIIINIILLIARIYIVITIIIIIFIIIIIIIIIIIFMTNIMTADLFIVCFFAVIADGILYGSVIRINENFHPDTPFQLVFLPVSENGIQRRIRGRLNRRIKVWYCSFRLSSFGFSV